MGDVHSNAVVLSHHVCPLLSSVTPLFVSNDEVDSQNDDEASEPGAECVELVSSELQADLV